MEVSHFSRRTVHNYYAEALAGGGLFEDDLRDGQP
jgi:hypothetical protein